MCATHYFPWTLPKMEAKNAIFHEKTPPNERLTSMSLNKTCACYCVRNTACCECLFLWVPIWDVVHVTEITNMCILYVKNTAVA